MRAAGRGARPVGGLLAMHLLRRLSLIAATAMLVAPAAADAKKVTKLEPWGPNKEYLIKADLDGRPLPKLKPVAKVNHVRQGDWVKVECQVEGQVAYGSNLWLKVNGLFVPDKYVKTYTDGPLQGAPRCQVDQPAPQPTPQPQPVASGPSLAQLSAAVSSVAFERVYGRNYGLYKRTFPGKYPAGRIIWKNNGCSVPEKIFEVKGPRGIPAGKGVKFYADLFEKSCDRHDFGYRNYGSKTSGSMKLDPSPARRAQIDTRFKTNMEHQCQVIFSRKYVEFPQRAACRKAADAFYWAVSNFAQDKFS